MDSIVPSLEQIANAAMPLLLRVPGSSEEMGKCGRCAIRARVSGHGEKRYGRGYGRL